MEQSSKPTVESLSQEIQRQKDIHLKLLSQQTLLSGSVTEQKHFAEEFCQRSAILRKHLVEEEHELQQCREDEKTRLGAALQEKERLETEVQKVQTELLLLEELSSQLDQQMQVPFMLPEKSLVFTGVVNDSSESSSFDIKADILYPMEGGTALITFEDEAVAQNILKQGQHKVQLGECFINLQAEPMHLLMPSRVQMDTNVCSKRILVSSLPKNMEESRLLDKLEIYFSKKRHGGGEVENVELLHDTGNVVVTFLEDAIANGLCDKQYIEVEFEVGKKHTVQVTPFRNGNITELQTRMTECKRTVLLTGIPAIMEQEELQDQIEIHFQKSSKGGGEVEALLYNPLSHSMIAVFEEDCPIQSP